MYLAKLRLRHFRNYGSLDIDFSPGLNVVYGANAQGKTNLLESIYYLATARSHRTSRDADLLEQGEQQGRVEGLISRLTGELQMELRYGHDSRKALKINGVPERRIAKLVGKLAVVLFSPDDLLLIKGAPGLRRRFLDIELCQISETYLYHLQQYQRALTQRNALLRTRNVAPGLLAVWNEPLMEHGAQVISRRVAAVRELGVLADEYHQLLSGSKESLQLAYRSEIPLGATTVEDLQAAMAGEFERRYREEIARGVTLVGPHRDDLAVLINQIEARLYGSQGQQRTAVLAMKLAELRYMQQVIGESPVLLLDDVASELDPTRRNYLLQAVDQGIQTFVSCTDIEDLMLKTWPAVYQVLEVRAGQIMVENEGG